jgi:hypothetical protein
MDFFFRINDTILVLSPRRRMVLFLKIPHSVRNDPFIRVDCENATHFRQLPQPKSHSEHGEESSLVVLSIYAVVKSYRSIGLSDLG